MNDLVAEALVCAGMSERAAKDKAVLFRAVERELPASVEAEPFLCFVPGRLEILGNDMESSGGRSLICAAEQGYCVAAVPRSDSLVRLKDVVRGQSFTVQISSDYRPPLAPVGASPAALIRRLCIDFPRLRHGADISFASDLPSVAGLGNSAALLVGISEVLRSLNQIGEGGESANFGRREDFAEYLNCVSKGQACKARNGANGGMSGGAEYAAILLSRARHLRQITSSPFCVEADVELPAASVFVVAVMGAIAGGATPSLARRSETELSSILDTWRKVSGTDPRSLFEVLDSTPEAADRIRTVLKNAWDGFELERLQECFEQFYLDSQVIIPQATAALGQGNLLRFGELVDDSRLAAKRWHEDQAPDAVWLAQQARSLGAYASSPFCGGNAWALVQRNDAESFVQSWRKSYAGSPHRQTSLTQFLVTEAGPAMMRI